MRNVKGILLAVVVALLAFPLHAAKMYRWVDKDGNVHYSDKVPPEAAKQERAVLNEQGVTTEKLDRQLTEEELEEKRRLEEEEAARQAAIDERRKHDEMLRQSYTTVADMENARDGRITALESQVAVTSRTIATLEQRLAGLELQAKRQREAGREPSETLQEQIANTREDLLENQKFLIERRAEQERIREQFNRDIERFKELTGNK